MFYTYRQRSFLIVLWICYVFSISMSQDLCPKFSFPVRHSSSATVSYITLFISFTLLTIICDFVVVVCFWFTHKLSMSSTGRTGTWSVRTGTWSDSRLFIKSLPPRTYWVSFEVTCDLLATDRPILETKFLIVTSSFHQTTVCEAPSI